jgi:hypothetical protein
MDIKGRKPRKFARLAVLMLAMLAAAPAAAAEAPAVSAKQFPAGFFYRYQKAPVQEKAEILGKIDATLRKLNAEGQGLIAKGAVIDRLGTDQKVYASLSILDESGLIIIAHRVPNLYYRYAGPAPINPNIYLIIRKPRLNVPESYIRYGFVVEGDYAAYAQKFVAAIIGNLEDKAGRDGLPPAQK